MDRKMMVWGPHRAKVPYHEWVAEKLRGISWNGRCLRICKMGGDLPWLSGRAE
jgi:hypothetical protein